MPPDRGADHMDIDTGARAEGSNVFLPERESAGVTLG